MKSTVRLFVACTRAWRERERFVCAVFSQIIKQLTRNPNPSSVAKGWQLLCVCLETFPPRSEFENYLEMFLREQAQPRDKYILLIHQSIYGGPLAAPPTDAQIRQIVAGQVR